MSDVIIPKEVEDAAEMAEQLHSMLYPTAQAENEEENSLPDKEEETQQNDQQANQQDEDEEATYERRYKHLQGKYNAEVPRMAKQLKELEQHLQELQAARETVKETAAPSKIDEVIARLKEGYPEDFVEDIDTLLRYRSEEVAQRVVQPVQSYQQATEEAQHDRALENHINTLNQKSPVWEKVWHVAEELGNGLEPSDPRVAEFLTRPDPSGLYTNYQLLVEYDKAWDADRFATLCNMYEQQPAQRRNPSREAMLAPSRSNNQPSSTNQEKRIWTMHEFEQMQRDERAGKLDEQTAAALWQDATAALQEGRFR
jgi:hypothetical protein